jgi:hypothetical protein
VRRLVWAGLLALGFASVEAQAEPVFLTRQYTRCTTCHYSPTGGGLLTPYGRSLSRHELSTTGAGAAPDPTDTSGHEEDFLWGLAGHDPLGPVQVGIDMRPAHLNIDDPGGSTTQNMFMTADLIAAYRVKGWTIYGEIGREPLATGAKIDSYEYWVSHDFENGWGLRVGRYLPAYGVRLADHTAENRIGLGLDVYDQLYGLEVSHSSARQLVQLSVSPGRAESILHDDGLKAFTASARYQFDLTPRTVLVASGLYRDASRLEAQNGAAGVSVGFAPYSRLSLWAEGDAQFQHGSPGAPAYTLFAEAGFEVYRGLWLKVSPQLRTDYGDTSGGTSRLVLEANLLPRTHINVDISYYRDRARIQDLVTKTFLAQLHLYI